MTTDDNRESLADAAAAWIPPWDRPKPAVPEPADPEPVAEAEPVVRAEPAAERTVPEAVTGPETAGPAPVADDRDPRAGDGTDTRAQDGPERAPGEAAASGAEPAQGAGPEAVGAPAVPSQKGRNPTTGAEVAGEGRPAAEAAPRRRRAKSAPKEPEPDPVSLIDDAELRGALEAILLVVDEPVAEVMLSQVLEQPTERVTQMLYLLAGEYTDRGHGFDLRRVAGGWRLYTRPEYAAYVERFVLDGQTARLTQAALETLAVVAYKQPCSRSQVSAIRGVNCDGVMRTLVTRGLVEECGADVSGAYLYKTTTLFLEKLGLDSVAQLPPLAPFLPDNVEEIVIDA